MSSQDRLGGRARAMGGHDDRQRMIAEHSAFLSWALVRHDGLPRIPRRRVSRGGFVPLLRQPGARAAVDHWWRRVLEQLGA